MPEHEMAAAAVATIGAAEPRPHRIEARTPVAPPASLTEVQAPEAAPSAAPRATREIVMRISTPDALPVDVQVKERGGAVHVAVRTGDGEMQTALRQDLGSLVERLETTGLRTEAVLTREAGPRVEGRSEEHTS